MSMSDRESRRRRRRRRGDVKEEGKEGSLLNLNGQDRLAQAARLVDCGWMLFGKRTAMIVSEGLPSFCPRSLFLSPIVFALHWVEDVVEVLVWVEIRFLALCSEVPKPVGTWVGCRSREEGGCVDVVWRRQRWSSLYLIVSNMV